VDEWWGHLHNTFTSPAQASVLQVACFILSPIFFSFHVGLSPLLAIYYTCSNRTEAPKNRMSLLFLN
jgi:hypothetical protein